MDEALAALARRALADPENAEAWSRLLDAARSRGWRFQGRDLDACWAAVQQAEDRTAAVEELRAAHPLDLALSIERLAKGGWRERLIAAEALGLRGSRAASPVLRRALRDELKEVRAAALSALRAIDPQDPKTLTALCAGLESHKLGIKNWSAEALGALGRGELGLAEVTRDLESPSALTRADVLKRLGALGAAAGLSLARARLRDDPDPMVRVAAARALGDLAHHAPEALDELLPLLENPDALLHEAAIGALAQNEAGERAAPTLLAMARDREHPRAVWAAHWLATLAPLQPGLSEIVGPLIEQAEDSRHRERVFVSLRVLSRAAGFPVAVLAPAIPLLVCALKNGAQRRRALEILAEVPGGADTALGELREELATAELLADRRRHLRRVAEALGVLRAPGPEAREMLRRLLNDSHSEVRQAAIEACASCQEAGELLPDLVFFLGEAGLLWRPAAVAALASLAPGLSFDPATVAALRGVLEEDLDLEVRANAARALMEELGGAALREPELLAAVRANLGDDEAEDVLDQAFDEALEPALRARALAFVRDEDLEPLRLRALEGHPAPELRGC